MIKIKIKRFGLIEVTEERLARADGRLSFFLTRLKSLARAGDGNDGEDDVNGRAKNDGKEPKTTVRTVILFSTSLMCCLKHRCRSPKTNTSKQPKPPQSDESTSAGRSFFLMRTLKWPIMRSAVILMLSNDDK